MNANAQQHTADAPIDFVMSARAVILAAGKSSKFFPPLCDKPKGLFTFNGEVLVERQMPLALEIYSYPERYGGTR